jgi:hypothetical protein
LESDKIQHITNLRGSDRKYKDCISHSVARTLTYWASTNAYVSCNWIIVLFELILPREMSVLGSFRFQTCSYTKRMGLGAGPAKSELIKAREPTLKVYD